MNRDVVLVLPERVALRRAVCAPTTRRADWFSTKGIRVALLQMIKDTRHATRPRVVRIVEREVMKGQLKIKKTL